MSTISLIVIVSILVSWALINILIDRRKPKPITLFTYIIMENDMKQAIVKLVWTPSVSTDVTVQKLSVKVGDADVVLLDLAPSISEYSPVNVPEKTAVHCEIYPSDGTNDGSVTTLDFTLGDLTVPEPVTGFGYVITEVVDV